MLWSLSIVWGADNEEAKWRLMGKSNDSEQLVSVGHRRGPAAGSWLPRY